MHNSIKILLVILLSSLMGCSATSLRCGVDGDSFYVDLVTNQDVNSQIRTFKDLCHGKTS